MMNIIRTTAVELTAIPAIAYKMKLSAGGAGLRILRLDRDAAGVFSIDRRTGEAVPYGKADAALFPDAAVDEALELTTGLPYSSRGKIRVMEFEQAAETEVDVTEEEADKLDMVDTDAYRAILERYSDEKGKLNYQLMNKDFIQFASRSTTVAKMVAGRATEEELLLFTVRSRVDNLTRGKEGITDAEAEALIETLDEIDPRSAFKELKAYFRRLLARK